MCYHNQFPDNWLLKPLTAKNNLTGQGTQRDDFSHFNTPIKLAMSPYSNNKENTASLFMIQLQPILLQTSYDVSSHDLQIPV